MLKFCSFICTMKIIFPSAIFGYLWCCWYLLLLQLILFYVSRLHKLFHSNWQHVDKRFRKIPQVVWIGHCRVSHSGGHGGHPHISKPPTKTDASHGAPPHLKNEAPNLKNNPSPLKHETPFCEMIPRKSTINNNLKSS